ncbi:hypothetical protein HPP92_012381 [Vanilla planifolia]|uniref:Uncharacterized protein n=1 Tax=Vanilla planifolia TaxID=51239 RepID=A0A835QZT8_VANPL|nr:hypothetical protein HPP92_012381 [Vanilla planifolia]
MAPKAKPKPFVPSANSQAPPSSRNFFVPPSPRAQNFEYEQAVKIADQGFIIYPRLQLTFKSLALTGFCKPIALVSNVPMVDEGPAVISPPFHPDHGGWHPLDESVGFMLDCPAHESLYHDAIPTYDMVGRQGPSDPACPLGAPRDQECGTAVAIFLCEDSTVDRFEPGCCTQAHPPTFPSRPSKPTLELGQEMLVDEDYADDEIETELPHSCSAGIYTAEMFPDSLTPIVLQAAVLVKEKKFQSRDISPNLLKDSESRRLPCLLELKLLPLLEKTGAKHVGVANAVKMDVSKRLKSQNKEEEEEAQVSQGFDPKKPWTSRPWRGGCPREEINQAKEEG